MKKFKSGIEVRTIFIITLIFILALLLLLLTSCSNKTENTTPVTTSENVEKKPETTTIEKPIEEVEEKLLTFDEIIATVEANEYISETGEGYTQSILKVESKYLTDEFLSKWYLSQIPNSPYTEALIICTNEPNKSIYAAYDSLVKNVFIDYNNEVGSYEIIELNDTTPYLVDDETGAISINTGVKADDYKEYIPEEDKTNASSNEYYESDFNKEIDLNSDDLSSAEKVFLNNLQERYKDYFIIKVNRVRSTVLFIPSEKMENNIYGFVKYRDDVGFFNLWLRFLDELRLFSIDVNNVLPNYTLAIKSELNDEFYTILYNGTVIYDYVTGIGV